MHKLDYRGRAYLIVSSFVNILLGIRERESDNKREIRKLEKSEIITKVSDLVLHDGVEFPDKVIKIEASQMVQADLLNKVR
jgi:hypothetical protein